MSKIRRFDEIALGCTDATSEAMEFPHLLVDGYLDSHGLAAELLTGHRFLVLGPKGSGKTAVAEHLRLVAASDPTSFVTLCNLGDFPYSDFRSQLGSEVARERYPGGWSWLLMGAILSSFARDAGARDEEESLFRSVVEALARTGLFAVSDETAKLGNPRGVRIKLGASLAFGVGGTFEFSSEPRLDSPAIPLSVLKHTAQKFQSDSRHFLIIDGLDDILAQPEVRYDALAGLLYAVSDLNLTFEADKTPAKIILLCRTELFERLPSANKNKMRHSSAIVLDWYDSPTNGERCSLADLVNLRARISDPSINDVFGVFFPEQMTDGNRTKPTLQWLLDLTRFTPRDFIQLLTYIQERSGGTEGRLSSDVVRSGIEVAQSHKGTYSVVLPALSFTKVEFQMAKSQ